MKRNGKKITAEKVVSGIQRAEDGDQRDSNISQTEDTHRYLHNKHNTNVCIYYYIYTYILVPTSARVVVNGCSCATANTSIKGDNDIV